MRVVDDDAYVEAIEHDYFPDISKLRDRLEWIQARGPIQIRDAQLKIIERRGKKANHLAKPLEKEDGNVTEDAKRDMMDY
ncbi:hypothetical protein AALP_AA6G154300 [Arabis alpina]|uniref:Uncharacterized protein n=1 Tax=Arabis alpina TaxID=50452 RepID=A0A087GPE8_ARAAL|nr:hypothetical protein AALP_AA6G154300 [Arabis alpina]